MDWSKLRTTAGLEIAGKRILVRADLNVPVEGGKVTDRTRLVRLLPGIEGFERRGAKVVLISHFGRPKGRDPQFTLKPVADELARLLGREVAFAPDCIGEAAARVVAGLKPGGVAILENLRFHAGEEKNDRAFARELAKNGELYVDDAFSSAHRAHASTDAVTDYLPAYAGPLLMEEVEALVGVLERPERPTAAVIGGAKISSKISVLRHLVEKIDCMIIGGGMANTFLLAQGVAIGRSLSESDLTRTALDVLAAAKARGCHIVLPVDVIAAEKLEPGAETWVGPAGAQPAQAMILDVGPRTVAEASARIAASKTLVWNGPLGAFEVPPFGEGTFALALAVAERTEKGQLISVAGGGDTVAALNAAGVADKLSYVSTAGGAFLEWLEGRELPGIAALARAAR
jgi:phosphoglycerate kinase